MICELCGFLFYCSFALDLVCGSVCSFAYFGSFGFQEFRYFTGFAVFCAFGVVI